MLTIETSILYAAVRASGVLGLESILERVAPVSAPVRSSNVTATVDQLRPENVVALSNSHAPSAPAET